MEREASGLNSVGGQGKGRRVNVAGRRQTGVGKRDKDTTLEGEETREEEDGINQKVAVLRVLLLGWLMTGSWTSRTASS